FPDTRSRNVGVLDILRTFFPGLPQYVLALGPRLGQLGFYFLGVGQTLGDLLAPGFEDLEDRSIGQGVQQRTDDGEADYLGSQMRPVDAERRGNLFDLPGGPVLLGQGDQQAHDPRPISRGTGRRKRSPPQRRWPESTEPALWWTPRDCVLPPPTPSFR